MTSSVSNANSNEVNKSVKPSLWLIAGGLVLAFCVGAGLLAKHFKIFSGGNARSPAALTIRHEVVAQQGAAPSLPGKRLTVHYEVFISEQGAKGKKIDSSRDRNVPFDFLLGTGQVFAGWDKAMEGSKVGTKREVLIPAEMAYGSNGVRGMVPPNTDLILEFEVLRVD